MMILDADVCDAIFQEFNRELLLSHWQNVVMEAVHLHPNPHSLLYGYEE